MTRKYVKKPPPTLEEEIEHLAVEDDESVLDETATEEIHSDTFSITSYGADYTVDGLVKRMMSESFYVPPFQRSFVWNQRQSSRFIESLLMGLPVPGIFVFKESDARHLIVDGQQRLKTLESFFAGSFRERKFRLLDVNERWAARTYAELDEEDRQRLDDAIIHTTIFKQDQPQDGKRSIYEVFERINTGGLKLSAQEIRSSVNPGSFVDLLRHLNESDAWRELYGRVSDRLKDQELILRFLALSEAREIYKRPMRRFLDTYLERNADLQPDDVRRKENLFVKAIEFTRKVVGEDAFRPEKQLNAAVFDSVMIGVSERLKKKLVPDSRKVRGAYNALLRDDVFRAAYLKSTADEEQVRKRLGLAIAAFSET